MRINHNKKALVLVLGIMLLIIVGIAVYKLFSNVSDTRQPAAVKNNAVPRKSDVSIRVTEDTAKWTQHYSRELTFNYPPEWSVKDIRPGYAVLYTPDLLEPPKGTPISIYVIDSKPFDQAVADVKGALEETKEQSTTVRFLPGVEVSGSLEVAPYGKVMMYVTLANAKNKAIVVEYIEYPDTASYSHIYKGIVQQIEL